MSLGTGTADTLLTFSGPGQVKGDWQLVLVMHEVKLEPYFRDYLHLVRSVFR